MSAPKKALCGMSLPELEALSVEMGEKPFRARQLNDWLMSGASFEQMSNLPRAFLEKLGQFYEPNPASILSCFESKLDGTQKFLFSFADGHCVEGVLMRYRYGLSFCLSTQVGCRMGCAFCASTLDGCVRGLGADEMLGMLICVNARLKPERIHNLVLMGSGEPFDNYDEVLRFLRLANSKDKLNLGIRHISLSTCGLSDRIRDFTQEDLPLTLSISLHAPNDALRRQIMPVAVRYPLQGLMEACRAYVLKTGRRIVFEYALIHDFNCGLSQANELAALLRGLQCHVNLIPLNDVKERNLRAATPQEIKAFMQALLNAGISTTLRREMGSDISGACGQLRRQYLKDGAKEEEKP